MFQKIKTFKENYTKWLNFIAQVSAKNRRLLMFSIALWALKAAFQFGTVFVSAALLGHIQENIGTASFSIGILALLACVAVFPAISALLDSFSWNFEGHLENLIQSDIYCQHLGDLFKAPKVLGNGKYSAELIALLKTANANIEQIILRSVQAVFAIFSLILSGAILVRYDVKYALIVILFLFLNGYIKAKIEKSDPKWEALCEEEAHITAVQTDHLDNADNILALNIVPQVVQKIHESVQDIKYRELKYSFSKDLQRGLNQIMGILSTLIIGFLAIQETFDSGDIGRFALITGMAATFSNDGMPLSFFYGWVVRHLNLYHNLMKKLEYDTTLIPKSGKGKLGTIKEISLEKVCFTYPEEKSPVLNNLSLKIKAGSRVAIIGNSGMGKSTLINVMQHAYEIQSGNVLYNGKNVQGISRESLRDNLTYIDQHPTFWSQKTIKENLLMFNPKATDAELYHVLNLANLLDEITQKEKGIDSKVTALSAGQKQRLALARAFLRHTPLIIMDEPTANLDTHAQTKVLEGIKNLSKVKGHKPTVIFASNVPAEIASANRILLLEKGQIVEDGTPKKLMTNENSKTYKRLKKYKALFLD